MFLWQLLKYRKISRKGKEHVTIKSYCNIASLSLTNHESYVEEIDCDLLSSKSEVVLVQFLDIYSWSLPPAINTFNQYKVIFL